MIEFWYNSWRLLEARFMFFSSKNHHQDSTIPIKRHAWIQQLNFLHAKIFFVRTPGTAANCWCTLHECQNQRKGPAKWVTHIRTIFIELFRIGFHGTTRSNPMDNITDTDHILLGRYLLPLDPQNTVPTGLSLFRGLVQMYVSVVAPFYLVIVCSDLPLI